MTPWPSWRISEHIIPRGISVVNPSPRVVQVLALDRAPTPWCWGTTRAEVPRFNVFRLMVSSMFNESLLAGSTDSALWSTTTSNLEHKLLNQNTFISTRINQ